MAELLIWAGVTFLVLHLLTDARRMVTVLRRRHSRNKHPIAYAALCQRCKGQDEGLKEAWWEVLTLIVLVGHLIMDRIG